MKFKFVKLPDEDNRFDKSTLISEFEEIVLDDIIQEFADFLSGCGFCQKSINIKLGLEEEDE